MSAPIYLGSMAGLNSMNGQLDYIRLYDGLLTAAEALTLYNNEN